jgi:hypothetical protein
MNTEIKIVASALLQARVDGKLTSPTHVMEIVRIHQPASGFSNGEWIDICKFIGTLEPADNIPAAKQVAELHELEIIL